MSDNIKVSIIVPVYNNEKYLPRCMDSLVNQTLDNIEIIAADDCSSDSSLTILREYEKKYPDKVKVIARRKNGGPGGARNSCLNIASGEYIGFVDSDDYVKKDMFKKLYRIAKRADYDLVECGCYWEAENKYAPPALTDNVVGVLDINKRKSIFSNLYDIGWLCTKIVKRNIITDNNLLFRENVVYEDVDYILLLLYYSTKIGKTNDHLYHYTNNEESITNLYTINIEKKVGHYSEFFKRTISRFKENKAYKTYKEEINFTIFFTYGKLLRHIVVLLIASDKVDFKIPFDINMLKNLRDLILELDCGCEDNPYTLKNRSLPEIQLAYANNNDYTKTIELGKKLFL